MGIPSVSIKSATFSDGTDVQFGANDIVVFVGPNNAGKSAALRNIRARAQDPLARAEVITALSLDVEGTADDLTGWLESQCRHGSINPAHPNPAYATAYGSIAQSTAKHFWTARTDSVGDLAGFFVCLLTTEARLTAANPAPNIALEKDHPRHPIHYMQLDYDIEKKVSDYFLQAFGQELMVHRNAGSEVPLHCGTRPNMTGDPTYVKYYRAVSLLPSLQSQGDGMRSFVGVVLHSLIVPHTVILIDEPEAFLHPPQARLMGQMIARESPSDRQVFIGTHSGDLLRGLLDVPNERVRIIRLQRNGNTNVVSQLRNSETKEIWSDPLLRYSNILDGLYHNRVVICEGDSDCRFYAALDTAVTDLNPTSPRHDAMFTHCGGKARLPTVIGALRKLRVPVSVVVDFDVLSEKSPLDRIVESLGGKWDEISDDWTLVRNSVESKKSELSTPEVNQKITAILNDVKEKAFPEKAKERIREILRRSSPWSIAKHDGKPFVPSGEPHCALERMLAACKGIGLFIVEVGELEGFARTVSGHGPAWVNGVLTQKHLATDSELDGARSFVRQLLAG